MLVSARGQSNFRGNSKPSFSYSKGMLWMMQLVAVHRSDKMSNQATVAEDPSKLFKTLSVMLSLTGCCGLLTNDVLSKGST